MTVRIEGQNIEVSEETGKRLVEQGLAVMVSPLARERADRPLTNMEYADKFKR